MDIARNMAVLRAVITNVVAMIAPRLYVRLVADETGRGFNEEDDEQLEAYCFRVFDDYKNMFEAADGGFIEYLKDKTIIEYGPGDFLGVALIFLCNGAREVHCIDRFPLRNDDKYLNLYKRIINRCSGEQCNAACWDEIINRRIKYISAKDGVYPLENKADIIISRAVLEHCNNLGETFRNFYQNLKPGGILIHEVDLTSHGMHLRRPLDFLTYSPRTWSFMTSHKGYPNRWRRNTYKEFLDEHGFEVLHEKSLYEYSMEDVTADRPRFPKIFKDLPVEDLRCSNYSFVAKKGDDGRSR